MYIENKSAQPQGQKWSDGPARLGRVTFSKTRKGELGWQHYLKQTLLLCIQRQPLKPLRPRGRIVYPLFHLEKREA